MRATNGGSRVAPPERTANLGKPENPETPNSDAASAFGESVRNRSLARRCTLVFSLERISRRPEERAHLLQPDRMPPSPEPSPSQRPPSSGPRTRVGRWQLSSVTAGSAVAGGRLPAVKPVEGASGPPEDPTPAARRVDILGVDIDAVTWPETLARITAWAVQRESRSIAVCNVHSVVTARWDPHFGQAITQADMAVPDGMPLAWFMRTRGAAGQPRINGPDLMLRLCAWAEAHGESVFLYGTTPATLHRLKAKLRERYPALRIAGTIAPPFRPLTAEEDAEVAARINASGAGLVFVALGCPKQEKWAHDHRGEINAVMIGVGVAFDYYAGNVRRAPHWMQRSGLEWAYRLVTEPRRLWRRYLVTNAVFITRMLTHGWRRRG